MDELRLRQREALAAVLKAEKELEQKQQETERSRWELEEAEAIKARAAGEADFAAKSVAGDDYAAHLTHLAEGLQRHGYAERGRWSVEPVDAEEDGGPLWDGMLASAPTSAPAAHDEACLPAVFQGAELRAAEDDPGGERRARADTGKEGGVEREIDAATGEVMVMKGENVQVTHVDTIMRYAERDNVAEKKEGEEEILTAAIVIQKIIRGIWYVCVCVQ